MFKQAALSSSNNAVEFLSFDLESSHASKMRKMLLTDSLESRVISRTVEPFSFNDTPSWNCSDAVNLSRANLSRKALSNSSKKIKKKHQLNGVYKFET